MEAFFEEVKLLKRGRQCGDFANRIWNCFMRWDSALEHPQKRSLQKRELSLYMTQQGALTGHHYCALPLIALQPFALIYLYIGTRYRRTVNKQIIDFKSIPAAPPASLGSMVVHTFAACCIIFTTTKMAHDDRITSIVRNHNF